MLTTKSEQISENKMAMLGLLQGNIVLLGCILSIIHFIVSCILWIFTANVPFMKKPSIWFALTKCFNQWHS